jgi:mono/diheme cytochrome c family protein
MRKGMALLHCAALATLVGAAAVTGHAQAQPKQVPPILLESLTGRESFELYCAPCHGPGGRGDGPVAAALRTPPADLTTLARRHEGRYPRDVVRAFVTGSGRALPAHGTSEMPVWGALFRALEPDARARVRIDNLVTYIESIQAPSTLVLDTGSQLFRTHCAPCHGASGRGDGPLADQLRRMPPDLTKFTDRNGGVFPSERVRRIIDGRDVRSHGDREMPVWGDVFRTPRAGGTTSPEAGRIDAIVRYLQAIQQRGV